MVPPVRTPEHQTALWQGFLEGSINTVGTDNTSRARATKKPEAGLHGSRPGLPALGTHLPALLHYGRLRGVPLEILIERATRSPAQVYGIYPQKGTIAVGSDADLVVYDPNRSHTISAATHHMDVDYSCYEGRAVRGGSDVVLSRGSVVVATENYRVVSSRYNVGVATVLDLSVAEQTLATAEQQLVNARYDYQLARANLQSLIGRDV